MLEREFYDPVGRWAQRMLGCFAIGIDTGLRHGRIDVMGLRDSGGRLSGRADVIAIEVKRGTQPFATSIGQASGYSIYADRCYLAEYRPGGFTDEHHAIAAQLGVGLIQISGEKRIRIREVLTAPLREPLEGLRLEIIEKLKYSLCAVCGSLFQRGDDRSPFSRVAGARQRKGHVEKAVHNKQGIMYWLDEQYNRSRGQDTDINYHRRYLCPDCVYGILSHTVD